MRYYFAPMEGITTSLYRKLHHRYFPGVDQYYTPFLSPARDHVFSKRDLQEICPEYQEGVPLVPQLLTKYPEDFIWAAGELSAMGYREVNLNLGCPSGTVVAKGRGAGMLEDLEFLDRFLNQIFSAFPSLHISIKTRVGIFNEDSFPELLELYNRYPIWELTVHPRVQKDFYKHKIRWQAFSYAAAHSKNPLCYNGDLLTPEDCRRLEQEMPSLRAAMVGRGLVSNPAMITRLCGGPSISEDTWKAFHDALYEGYCQQYQNRANAVMRMKELWSYMVRLLPNGEKVWKGLRKAANPSQYEEVVQAIFQECCACHEIGKPELSKE